ncbi:alpha/beta fold hydrolase [Microbacterium sp. KNMS]
MATFLLIHGAGSDARYWARVSPPLRHAGHEVVAPDLPVADDDADLESYAAASLNALGERAPTRPIVVVGQSMGAFTAPIVAERLHADLLLLLCPMIPAPGEAVGAWFANVGQAEAAHAYAAVEGFDPEGDVAEILLHDVPADLVRDLVAQGAPPQAEGIFASVFPLERWPAIPTAVIAGRDDRLFPLALIRRLAAERVPGAPVQVIESGHLPGFSRPEELAELLVRQLELLSPSAG